MNPVAPVMKVFNLPHSLPVCALARHPVRSAASGQNVGRVTLALLGGVPLHKLSYGLRAFADRLRQLKDAGVIVRRWQCAAWILGQPAQYLKHCRIALWVFRHTWVVGLCGHSHTFPPHHRVINQNRRQTAR